MNGIWQPELLLFYDCWSMIFSENRFPARIKSGPGSRNKSGAGFFGIMLWA
jgi:hypothetical protein